jgi:hypothetical protein
VVIVCGTVPVDTGSMCVVSILGEQHTQVIVILDMATGNWRGL